ncbi:unnamed protein product, partial [marine sediment metagenome]
MLQNVERLEKQTTAFAAIADGIYALLPVRNTMNQPGFGSLLEDIAGLLPGNLAPQAVLVDVLAKPAEVQAYLSGVLAIGRVRIQVFPVLAWTGGYAEILLSIQHLHYIFVGEDLSGVFYGLFDRQSPKAFSVNLGILVHETVKVVSIHKRRHGLAVLVGAPRPEDTAVKNEEGVIEA